MNTKTISNGTVESQETTVKPEPDVDNEDTDVNEVLPVVASGSTKDEEFATFVIIVNNDGTLTYDPSGKLQTGI